MKIGIIFCGRYCEDTVAQALEPFLDFDIAFVSAPFSEYEEQDNSATEKIVNEIAKDHSNLECLFTNEKMKEHQARTLALRNLNKRGVYDYIWLVDADEFYTKEQIENVLEIIKSDRMIAIWDLYFKNFVFDNSHFIDDTCSPRIFKGKYRKYDLHDFTWDCDPAYRCGEETFQGNPSKSKIPLDKCWVHHLSWPSNERGKAKVAYQEKHFAHGAGCSYRWNEEKNCLEFNPVYFEKTGKTIPKVYEQN